MEATLRQTRKFRNETHYDVAHAGGRYFLLPFRFHRLSPTREALVNELGDFLIVPSGTAKRIISGKLEKDIETDLYADLTANYFISEKEVPVLLDVMAARYRTKKSFLDFFTELHIFVITLRCEHTCHYCQVSRVTENKSAYDMRYEHIDAGIELMMRSPNPHVTMEFQGGEALLAFDRITYAVGRAKEQAYLKNKQITFVICTNLAPLTDEMVAYCKEHHVLISTSIDGPDYIHNQNRHRPEKNSYQVAVDGINKCREALGHDRVSALLTTTNLTLRFPNEVVDQYYDLGFTSIFLRPISPYGFATHNSKKNRYNTDLFLTFYKQALSRIIDYNLKGSFYRENYAAIILKKMLTPFPVGYVDLQSPAGMINSVIVFNYDGKVYASDEARMLAEMKDETFLLGELGTSSYESIFYGEKTMAISEAWLNESLPGCSDCAFQPYCGADPVLHHATQGDVFGHRPTSVFCQKNIEIIRHLLELIDSDKRIEKVFRSWVKD